MKVDQLSIYSLNIPFVDSFQHAAKDRKVSDAIIVEVSALGQRGYGEALPREYVSGESTLSVVQHLTQHVWPLLQQAQLGLDTGATLLQDVAQVLDAPEFGFEPQGPSGGLLAHHSARCALELAIVDCWLQARQQNLGSVLLAQREQAVYSGVISTGSVERAAALARKMRLGGLKQVKIKVGDEQDEQRVAAVREALGPDCSLRVDANGAWTLPHALTKLTELARYGIESCEEPLGRERRADLARLTAQSPVPILVDESLVTRRDADELIAQRACHGFNLRLSKLGGLGPCLNFAKRAAEAGIWCQLGSHVGETSILAAAGRQLALHLSSLRYVEGSFGSLLLSQDVASPSVKFGHGGRAGALRANGLGVNVVPERLREFAVDTWCSG